MRLALEKDQRLMELVPPLQLGKIAALGRKHVRTRQRFLCGLIAASYERRRPHAIDRQADSFSREFLRKGLRVSNRKDAIWPFLCGLYDFDAGNHGYCSKRGVTKAYRLRKGVKEALDEVYSSQSPLDVVTEDSKPPPPASANGLPSSAAGLGIHVPSTLRIPLADVDHALERVEGWIEEGCPRVALDPMRPNGTDLRDARRILQACRKWVVSLGGLPNLYGMQRSGRMGPAQGVGGPHVITLPRAIRHLLLNRSNLYDYDLASCHWSVFRSLARSQGAPTPWTDGYLRNKADWHSRWAGVTGHRNADDFKPIAASWLTGGTLSASPKTSGAQTLGRESMARFACDRYAEALHGEVRRLLPKLLKDSTAADWPTAYNAVGRPMDQLEPGFSKGRLHSHLLTGFEQFAIRAVCRRVEGVEAIVYDGFIAPQQDVGVLEDAIREESEAALGFPLDLKLKCKPFSLPVRKPEWDSDDF